MGGDRGDIVLGWLTRLVAVLGLLGLLGHDAVSLTTTHLRAQDAADTAARAASEAWAGSHDVQRAYDAAVATLDHLGDEVEAPTFTVSRTGAVDLRLDATATTLLVRHVGPARGWAAVSAPGHAAPS